MFSLTHSQINTAIRIVLGIDVAAICLLTGYFYLRNERLALRASKFGQVTYHAFGSIFTGIAYGHPDCPADIAKEYRRLRRLFVVVTLPLWVIPVLYVIFLRDYYH